MGVRTTEGEKVVALFDSTSGFAFGPTFESADEAEDFLEFATRHAQQNIRGCTNDELESLHAAWADGRDA